MKLHQYLWLLLDTYQPLLSVKTEKCLALTFDDGPDPKHTPLLLDLLSKLDAKATFFLVGQQAEKYPGMTKEIIAQGHEVANHSWSHSLALLQSKKRMCYEIEKTQSVLEDITGVLPRWFRPPFGIFGLGMEALLEERGLKPILWTQSLWDFRSQSQERLIKYFKRGLKSGAIYLMHDGAFKANYCDRHQTIKLLESQIPSSLKKGYQCVTLSTLMGGSL